MELPRVYTSIHAPLGSTVLCGTVDIQTVAGQPDCLSHSISISPLVTYGRGVSPLMDRDLLQGKAVLTLVHSIHSFIQPIFIEHL